MEAGKVDDPVPSTKGGHLPANDETIRIASRAERRGCCSNTTAPGQQRYLQWLSEARPRSPPCARGPSFSEALPAAGATANRPPSEGPDEG
jgi:hypothetical protein